MEAYLDTLDVAAAKALIIDTINDGVAYTSYVGHSGPVSWTFAGLFHANDAAALTNYGEPTVVTQWGCWNTYYVDPNNNTLAHKFLVLGEQGAAAVLGATGVSYARSEEVLGQLMTPYILSEGMTIGEAMRLAKGELAVLAPNKFDVLFGWTILGDPAVMIAPLDD